MIRKPATLNDPRKQILIVALAAFAAAAFPAFAQNSKSTVRYGDTSGHNFDGRDDNRDFPTNGVFPGNFAANPLWASIGAAGFLGSNPWHSPVPYPSQSYFWHAAGSEAGRSCGSDRSASVLCVRPLNASGAKHVRRH